MPEECQFEEDAFQQLIDIAIGQLAKISTTPGRVTEHVLGFDSAYFIKGELIRYFDQRLFDLRSRKERRWFGIRIDSSVWKNLTDIKKSKLPPFKLNLFIQSKVPEKLVGKTAGQWDIWKESYFRFAVRHPQHEILLRINDAPNPPVVCYAAPTFNDAETLWKMSESDKILDHSHFVRAGKLRTHEHYTYLNATSDGYGHSEPAEIPNERLSDIINHALESADGADFLEMLSNASSSIMQAVSGDTPIEKSFRRTISEASSLFSSADRDAYIVTAFETYFGIRVTIIG